jgi:hypothetical protein
MISREKFYKKRHTEFGLHFEFLRKKNSSIKDDKSEIIRQHKKHRKYFLFLHKNVAFRRTSSFGGHVGAALKKKLSKLSFIFQAKLLVLQG